jgi:hypothetical protein
MVNIIKSRCGVPSRSRCGIVVTLATGGLLLSFSASAAQDYPVSGVWVAATNSGHFPGTIMGACYTLKTLGIDALDQPFPEFMIFSRSKRFDVREGRKVEATIRSIKNSMSGSFQIIESLGRRGRKWLPWSDRNSYNLTIVESTIIEIIEGERVTRFVKCAGGRPDL